MRIFVAPNGTIRMVVAGPAVEFISTGDGGGWAVILEPAQYPHVCSLSGHALRGSRMGTLPYRTATARSSRRRVWIKLEFNVDAGALVACSLWGELERVRPVIRCGDLIATASGRAGSIWSYDLTIFRVSRGCKAKSIDRAARPRRLRAGCTAR